MCRCNRLESWNHVPTSYIRNRFRLETHGSCIVNCAACMSWSFASVLIRRLRLCRAHLNSSAVNSTYPPSLPFRPAVAFCCGPRSRTCQEGSRTTTHCVTPRSLATEIHKNSRYLVDPILLVQLHTVPYFQRIMLYICTYRCISILLFEYKRTVGDILSLLLICTCSTAVHVHTCSVCINKYILG